MPKLAALTVSIGVLAFVDVWLFGLAPLTAMKLQVWASFIAWGSHFQSGGKVAGARTAFVCMAFGAIVGLCAAIAIGRMASLGDFAAPAAVGVGAALIVVASRAPWLAAIPVCFFGFASIFALIGLKGLQPTAALLPIVLSALIGAAFGYISEVVADALAKKAPAPAAAAA